MTHDELLLYFSPTGRHLLIDSYKDALRAVVELHKPVLHSKNKYICEGCNLIYPCDTVEAIEKELQ